MEILLPVGRMIGGSLYTPQPKMDNFGKPKVDAQGKPMTGFNFGVAIAKTPGHTHWSQSEWGAKIRGIGVAAFQAMADNPSFAWKIIDGDSAIPNKKGRKPVEQEGYPGNWVLWFSQTWAPKLCTADGSAELTQPEAVMPGDWVQVYASVKSNAPSPTPGVYLNPLAVALVGYHQSGRITSTKVDTTAIGFGASAAPGVVLAAPVGAMPVPAPAPVAPPAVVTPNAAFLAGPPPVAPAPVAQPPVHQMTPAAGGASYESHIANGWTDALLVQHGLMLA